MFGKLKAKREEVEKALELKEEIDEIKELILESKKVEGSLSATMDTITRIESALEYSTKGTHVFSDCHLHNIKKELHGILKYEELSKTDNNVKKLLDILITERIQAKELRETLDNINSMIGIRKNRLFIQ